MPVPSKTSTPFFQNCAGDIVARIPYPFSLFLRLMVGAPQQPRGEIGGPTPGSVESPTFFSRGKVQQTNRGNNHLLPCTSAPVANTSFCPTLPHYPTLHHRPRRQHLFLPHPPPRPPGTILPCTTVPVANTSFCLLTVIAPPMKHEHSCFQITSAKSLSPCSLRINKDEGAQALRRHSASNARRRNGVEGSGEATSVNLGMMGRRGEVVSWRNDVQIEELQHTQYRQFVAITTNVPPNVFIQVCDEK